MRTRLVAAALLASVGALCAASPALAKQEPNPEFTAFKGCPVATHGIKWCVVATTTSGEFKIGSKTVPISKPIVLQGGLPTTEGTQVLVGPTSGETLSKVSLTVPGGLLGVAGLGGEVTATTELAGPVVLNENALLSASGVAVSLPVKVKLDNPTLGEECYIGSNAEPVTLQLTTGTTSPPSPNKPITGSVGKFAFNGPLTIETVSENKLVDNSFAAPGVNGCGGALSFLLDPLVDASAGLPAASGHNTAILEGTIQQTTAKQVKKAHVIPKEKKQ